VSKSAAIQTTEKITRFWWLLLISLLHRHLRNQVDKANVKSIFSAVYTDVAGSDYFPIGINKIGLLLYLIWMGIKCLITLSHIKVQIGSLMLLLWNLHIDIWLPIICQSTSSTSRRRQSKVCY
jgi:hypothetical protein